MPDARSHRSRQAHRLTGSPRSRTASADHRGRRGGAGLTTSALGRLGAIEGTLAAIEAAQEAQPETVQASQSQQARMKPADEPEPMLTGTVKWFNIKSGFGFIAPDDGSPDAFVHISTVERSGMSELHQGQRIAFELITDRRTGKPMAGNLRVLD